MPLQLDGVGGEEPRPDERVVVIGAGPAGLTAAYKLCQAGIPSVVLERDEVVGGLSRTVHHRGYHFDIGGHRFFTKVDAVERMWHEVLEDGDFLQRPRLSRIYYNRRFFYYPLKATNALLGLGLWTCFLILLSYVKARLFPAKDERTFEDWVSNRFGRRLYETFFKTYTEKVWGMPCNRISAEWAAQRIKGLSLLSAVKNALLKPKNEPKGEVVKTLIDSFHYPKRGPGMMWETVAKKVQGNGCELKLGRCVERIRWRDNKIVDVETATNGKTERFEGTQFVSSMAISELILKLDPAPPEEVLEAASLLKYRDFLTVALVIDSADLFPDNWIYIHDPSVKVGRIQNFKNWSPYMVPDPSKSCIGLEYFCFEGDGLWNSSDEELVELAKNELQQLGLARAADVEDGSVVRMAKAYPVYDDTYSGALSVIRGFLGTLDNVHPVGRNGMHKYNNQDHAMLTAMLAVENITGADNDVWSVNVDQDYHEEVREEGEDYSKIAATQPLVPSAVPSLDPVAAVLIKALARIDKLALALATGVVSSCYILLATLWLLLKGGEAVGPRLQLLGQYFYGFTVTYQGAFIGAMYGFLWGFVLGWLVAYSRNLMVGFYLHLVKRRAEAAAIRDFLSYI